MSRFSVAVGALLVSLVLALSAGVAQAEETLPRKVTGAALVVDGDTLHLFEGQSAAGNLTGKPLKVRLLGVDAPELDQGLDGWPAAGWVTAEILAANGMVTCQLLTKNKTGRHVGACAVNGRDLGVGLVEAGLARSATIFLARQKKYRAIVLAAEMLARNSCAGLWARTTCEPQISN